MIIKKIFIGTLLSIITSVTLFGYSWEECHGDKIVWKNSRADMYINTNSFSAGSNWDTKLQNAMYHWTDIKGSGFNFYVGYDNDGTYNNSNGMNEIYLNPIDGPNGVLAVTHARWDCYWLGYWHEKRTESDIVFDSAESWSLSTLAYEPSNSHNFEHVALHELGHALGLNHSNNALNVMNSMYPNGGTIGHIKESIPIGDDRSGLRYLYPDSTTEIDIAASVYKRIIDPDNPNEGNSGLVTSTNIGIRGSQSTLEYTFSNLGTSSINFQISFYLSTNNYISQYDILLGTTTAWAATGGTGTYSATFTIPNNISAGQYYLGFIVDGDNSFNEDRENNNYMEMPHPITIY